MKTEELKKMTGNNYQNPRRLFVLVCSFTLSALIAYKFTKKAPEGSAVKVLQLLTKYNTSKPKMVYSDLSHCPPRPEYFSEYKAHCWGRCLEGEECNAPASFKDVTSKRAKLRCVANVHLVGVRKSGTSDINKWFEMNKEICYGRGDYRIREEYCPIEWFENCKNIKDCNKEYIVESLKNGYFQRSSGNLLINNKVRRNSSHVTITTAMQYLGFMATPDTKFYVQLRNPTDRAISYLFHWHRIPGGRAIYPNLTLEQMNGEFVNQVISKYLRQLKECIAENGEFYCAYLSDGSDGDMNCLLPHSMYVVYIKEAFKFIPREQFQFNTLDDYIKAPAQFARNLTKKYFGVELPQEEMRIANSRKKRGKKGQVWKSTLKLLDEFYELYNRELADLLGDKKWLFEVNRDS